MLVRNFFGFSKTQSNGFVVLIILSALIFFSYPVYKSIMDEGPRDFSTERKIIESLNNEWKMQLASADSSDVKGAKKVKLFEFNPNNVTLVELDSLGFSKLIAKRLINYRTKVGAFRIKSEVKKIYGMDSLFYIRLYPFIQLPEKILEKEKLAKIDSRKELAAFDLNLADTSQLKSINGIGAVLAKRIIKYREALGGFVSNGQLKEVYGLDSLVVERIEKASFTADDFHPKKLNINLLDEPALSSHPYFSKKMAKVIVTYRFQHGNYSSVDDLRKIETLDKRTLDKVFPYLTVE
jgi:competence protein ComEA